MINLKKQTCFNKVITITSLTDKPLKLDQFINLGSHILYTESDFSIIIDNAWISIVYRLYRNNGKSYKLWPYQY